MECAERERLEKEEQKATELWVALSPTLTAPRAEHAAYIRHIGARNETLEHIRKHRCLEP
jgi:hypothetical protein